MSLKHWYFSFVFLLVANVSLGQVYPVQVNSTVVPPYLSSVAEYATTINQKYRVNLFTADLNVVNRQARLKLYIEGNGIQAQSMPVVMGAAPIYLNGGETVSLSNLDLAPYFRLENLQGINQKQYGEVLPQGSYKYCIEVYDYLTNQRISQKSCTFFYFLYNEPPLLNLPVNHDVLFFQEPQNIIFTWTPRHINATNIEYEFELVELLDNQAPSNYAFQVGAPVYSTTTNTTVVHYGPAEPQLIAGRKYAWRVKAISQAGFGETAVFNNSGYSEIYDFVYPGNCEAPKFVLASAVNATQAKINWQPDPKHLDYKVEYRKLSTETWFETAHYNNEAKIYDLEPGATYEFRVGGECLGNSITYSAINTFTQPTANTVAINCGIQPEIDLANQQVFTGELPNDQTIMAGDFAIKITEVSGSGAYSGKGYTTVPYLSKVKIGVAFKDIILNTDFKLIKGEIKAVYDPEWSSILDVSAIYDQIENVFDMISPDTDEHSFEVDFVIGNASDIQVNDNAIVVTGSNGESQTFDLDQGEMVIIRDEKGNVYGVAPGASEATLLNPNESAGFIPKSENTEGVSSNGTATSFATNGARATFKKADSSKYADDQKPANAHDKIKKLYKSIADGNTTYDLYHKGIQNDGKASRSFDYIEATVTITDSSIKEENILFNIKGTKPKEISKTVTTNGIVYILEVPVFETAATAELMALVKAGNDKNKLIGAAKIIPIKTQSDVNITLVPVNNATIPDGITTQLNAIYAEAGVQFKVTIAPNHEVAKNTLECGKDALLEKLSEDQSQFVEQYKAGKDIKKDQYYVFVTKGITPSRAISGFMPRHSQFGFVFTNQSGEEVKAGNDLATIIGHELGHGVFELEHPWEQFSTGDKNSNTPWLMDYALGTKLAYPHWQRISHPKFGLYVFDGSEKGEQATVTNLEQLKKFRNNDGSITFLSVAGIPITLKGNITDISFVTSEDKWNISKNFFPLGTLIGFTIDGKKYSASKTVNTNQFQGYAYYDKADNANNSYYEENITSKSKPKNILIGITCFKNNEPIFKIFPTDYFDKHPKTIIEKNRGAGQELSELSLLEYLNSESQAVEIYAKFDKDFSEEQLFFLDKYSKEGNICGASALNLFKAAYYINDSKGLLNCLQDAENDAQSSLTASLTAIREQNYNPNINHTRVITPRFEDGSYKADWEVKNKTQVFYAAFLRIIKNYYSTNKIKSSEYDTLENQDISDIVNFFDLGKAKGRTCLLRNIPFELRKKIIEKYSTWTITTDKESLLIDLIETLPNEDVSKFLDYLKQSNYKMLWELEDEINGSNSDRFAYVISSLILNTYQVPSELNSFPKTNETPNPNKSTRFLYLANNESFYYDGQSVTFNARADKSAGNLTLSCNTSYSQPYNGLSHYRMYYEGSPYDFVRVRFINDYRFSKLGSDESIKKDDEAIVPAYWYYWLLNRQNTVENIRNVRLVLDAAAVAASVLTAEPGPIVIVDGVVGAVDIGFQLNEEKLANGSEQDKAFYKEWDDLYTLYGSVVGAGILTKQLYNGGKYLFVNKNKIWENLKTSPSQLVKLGNGIKSVLKNIQFYKAANSGVKNRMYAYLLSAYLEIKISNFVIEANSGVGFIVKNGRLIAKTNSYETEIAKVIEDTNGSVLLNDLKLYTGKTEDVVSVEAKFAKVTENGSKGYELIKTKSGQFWLREILENNHELLIALKNDDFKKVYEALKNGEIKRVYSKVFNLEEEALVRFYQGESYYKFNKSLIEGSKLEEVITIEKLLNQTLDKIPSTSGNFSRGAGEEEVLKLLEKGEGAKMKYENFLSTSSEKEVAWNFVKRKSEIEKKVFITVKSKNGKSLEYMRDEMRGEFEMLHKSKSEFIIEEIKFKGEEILNIDDVALEGAIPIKVKNLYYVTLREL